MFSTGFLILLLYSFGGIEGSVNSSLCRTSVHFDGTNDGGFFEPKGHLHIPGLWNNNANSDEIINLNIYCQGKSDFSVVLSENIGTYGHIFQASKFSN